MKKRPFSVKKKAAFVRKMVPLLLLAIVLLPGLSLTPRANAAQAPDIWWPVDGAKVSGLQPFKAMLQGYSIDQYLMYWQVDNGGKVIMDSNYNGYPHKEAQVDLTGWNWRGSGPYALRFSAYDLGGNMIGERFVNIYLDTPSQQSSSVNTTTVSQTTTSSVQTSSGSVDISVPPQVRAVASSTTTLSAPLVTTTTATLTSYTAPSVPTPTTYNVQNWWPVDGSNVSGSQPFKGVLQDQDVTTYDMYWQVDTGQLNLMQNSYVDSPHKESIVDLSGWNWKGSGPYQITFVAKRSGSELARKSFNIYIGSASTLPAPAPITTTNSVSTPSLVSAPGDPFSGVKLYVNPNSNAKMQADAWRSSRPADAAQMDKIASQPQSFWMGGWNSNISSDASNFANAASSQGAMPVFVAYNIPFRDCGGYSAGGATDANSYLNWIKGLAQGIGGRKAAVVLEPDGLSTITCLSSTDQQNRLNMLSNAVSLLKNSGPVAVYIDAGHSNWVSASDMANRLKSAGIDKADGFALNVSNFMATSDETSYGAQVSQLVGGKHFVIDTSRNGSGSNGEWCNPSGRSLGNKPSVSTGNPLVDAYLWIKAPGESDGSCNGGPSAGTWWADYALGLAQRAAW